MVEEVFGMLKRICQYSGCNNIAEPGHTYCKTHLLDSQKKHREWLESHNKKKPFENAVRTNNYNNSEWRALRMKVLKRDNYQCRQCGATKEECGYQLEVHHIIPPKGNKELFYNIDNCVTLCKWCHARITQQEIINNKSISFTK